MTDIVQGIDVVDTARWKPMRSVDTMYGSSAVRPWEPRLHRTADGWVVSIRDEQVALLRNLTPGPAGAARFTLEYRTMEPQIVGDMKSVPFMVAEWWIEDRFGWVDRDLSNAFVWHPDSDTLPRHRPDAQKIYEVAMQHVSEALTRRPGEAIVLTAGDIHVERRAGWERRLFQRSNADLVSINAVTEALLSTPSLTLTPADVTDALATATR